MSKKTNPPKKTNPTQKPKIVPFHRSGEKPKALQVYDYAAMVAKDGRRIAVARIRDHNGIAIRLEKPMKNGTISRLDFALSRDAAIHLATLMIEKLS